MTDKDVMIKYGVAEETLEIEKTAGRDKIEPLHKRRVRIADKISEIKEVIEKLIEEEKHNDDV